VRGSSGGGGATGAIGQYGCFDGAEDHAPPADDDDAWYGAAEASAGSPAFCAAKRKRSADDDASGDADAADFDAEEDALLDDAWRYAPSARRASGSYAADEARARSHARVPAHSPLIASSFASSFRPHSVLIRRRAAWC
jgi:hypothetical protein